MSSIQGNWRIHQTRKLHSAKRIYQSVLSFILSINLMMVIPHMEVQSQSQIEYLDEPVEKWKSTMKTIAGVSVESENNRRTPERVEDHLTPLLNKMSDTRNPLPETIIPIEITKIHQEDLETEESMKEEELAETIAEPAPRYITTEEEYQLLCQLVEAEVEGYEIWLQKGLTHEEIINAKARVAQVFLNRVESNRFRYNTLKECIMEPFATSTLIDGRFYKVKVTEYTKEAVEVALSPYTPDMTQGALFFSSGPSEPYGGGTIFMDDVGHKFAR